MINAEVDGSGGLLLAVGCSVFTSGEASGVDGVADFSDAGPSIAPAPLFDFFFFVMLWTKFGQFATGLIFSRNKMLDSFRTSGTESGLSGKTSASQPLCNIHKSLFHYFIHPCSMVILRS